MKKFQRRGGSPQVDVASAGLVGFLLPDLQIVDDDPSLQWTATTATSSIPSNDTYRGDEDSDTSPLTRLADAVQLQWSTAVLQAMKATSHRDALDAAQRHPPLSNKSTTNSSTQDRLRSTLFDHCHSTSSEDDDDDDHHCITVPLYLHYPFPRRMNDDEDLEGQTTRRIDPTTLLLSRPSGKESENRVREKKKKNRRERMVLFLDGFPMARPPPYSASMTNTASLPAGTAADVPLSAMCDTFSNNTTVHPVEDSLVYATCPRIPLSQLEPVWSRMPSSSSGRPEYTTNTMNGERSYGVQSTERNSEMMMMMPTSVLVDVVTTHPHFLRCYPNQSVRLCPGETVCFDVELVCPKSFSEGVDHSQHHRHPSRNVQIDPFTELPKLQFIVSLEFLGEEINKLPSSHHHRSIKLHSKSISPRRSIFEPNDDRAVWKFDSSFTFQSTPIGSLYPATQLILFSPFVPRASSSSNRTNRSSSSSSSITGTLPLSRRGLPLNTIVTEDRLRPKQQQQLSANDIAKEYWVSKYSLGSIRFISRPSDDIVAAAASFQEHDQVRIVKSTRNHLLNKSDAGKVMIDDPQRRKHHNTAGGHPNTMASHPTPLLVSVAPIVGEGNNNVLQSVQSFATVSESSKGSTIEGGRTSQHQHPYNHHNSHYHHEHPRADSDSRESLMDREGEDDDDDEEPHLGQGPLAPSSSSCHQRAPTSSSVSSSRTTMEESVMIPQEEDAAAKDPNFSLRCGPSATTTTEPPSAVVVNPNHVDPSVMALCAATTVLRTSCASDEHQGEATLLDEVETQTRAPTSSTGKPPPPPQQQPSPPPPSTIIIPTVRKLSVDAPLVRSSTMPMVVVGVPSSLCTSHDSSSLPPGGRGTSSGAARSSQQQLHASSPPPPPKSTRKTSSTVECPPPPPPPNVEQPAHVTDCDKTAPTLKEKGLEDERGAVSEAASPKQQHERNSSNSSSSSVRRPVSSSSNAGLLLPSKAKMFSIDGGRGMKDLRATTTTHALSTHSPKSSSSHHGHHQTKKPSSLPISSTTTSTTTTGSDPTGGVTTNNAEHHNVVLCHPLPSRKNPQQQQAPRIKESQQHHPPPEGMTSTVEKAPEGVAKNTEEPRVLNGPTAVEPTPQLKDDAHHSLQGARSKNLGDTLDKNNPVHSTQQQLPPSHLPFTSTTTLPLVTRDRTVCEEQHEKLASLIRDLHEYIESPSALETATHPWSTCHHYHHHKEVQPQVASADQRGASRTHGETVINTSIGAASTSASSSPHPMAPWSLSSPQQLIRSIPTRMSRMMMMVGVEVDFALLLHYGEEGEVEQREVVERRHATTAGSNAQKTKQRHHDHHHHRPSPLPQPSIFAFSASRTPTRVPVWTDPTISLMRNEEEEEEEGRWPVVNLWVRDPTAVEPAIDPRDNIVREEPADPSAGVVLSKVHVRAALRVMSPSDCVQWKAPHRKRFHAFPCSQTIQEPRSKSTRSTQRVEKPLSSSAAIDASSLTDVNHNPHQNQTGGCVTVSSPTAGKAASCEIGGGENGDCSSSSSSQVAEVWAPIMHTTGSTTMNCSMIVIGEDTDCLRHSIFPQSTAASVSSTPTMVLSHQKKSSSTSARYKSTRGIASSPPSTERDVREVPSRNDGNNRVKRASRDMALEEEEEEEGPLRRRMKTISIYAQGGPRRQPSSLPSSAPCADTNPHDHNPSDTMDNRDNTSSPRALMSTLCFRHSEDCEAWVTILLRRLLELGGGGEDIEGVGVDLHWDRDYATLFQFHFDSYLLALYIYRLLHVAQGGAAEEHDKNENVAGLGEVATQRRLELESALLKLWRLYHRAALALDSSSGFTSSNSSTAGFCDDALNTTDIEVLRNVLHSGPTTQKNGEWVQHLCQTMLLLRQVCGDGGQKSSKLDDEHLKPLNEHPIERAQSVRRIIRAECIASLLRILPEELEFCYTRCIAPDLYSAIRHEILFQIGRDQRKERAPGKDVQINQQRTDDSTEGLQTECGVVTQPWLLIPFHITAFHLTLSASMGMVFAQTINENTASLHNCTVEPEPMHNTEEENLRGSLRDRPKRIQIPASLLFHLHDQCMISVGADCAYQPSNPNTISRDFPSSLSIYETLWVADYWEQLGWLHKKVQTTKDSVEQSVEDATSTSDSDQLWMVVKELFGESSPLKV